MPDRRKAGALADRTKLAVHAGVIAWNGRVALLPGASQAGKTTLVTELLKRGTVYYSDEYALLDTEGRVHAYPRALMLRESGGWQTSNPSLGVECYDR